MLFTVIIVSYPTVVIDGLHYSVSIFIYSVDPDHSYLIFLLIIASNCKYRTGHKFLTKNYFIFTNKKLFNILSN